LSFEGKEMKEVAAGLNRGDEKALGNGDIPCGKLELEKESSRPHIGEEMLGDSCQWGWRNADVRPDCVWKYPGGRDE
jgi:hypothetical protein